MLKFRYMTTSSEKNILDHLKSNWILYAFIVQVIMAFSSYSFRITSVEAQVVDLKQDAQKDNVTLSEINAKLASLQTSVDFIRAQVDRSK